MLFGESKKRQESLEAAREKRVELGDSYWHVVRRQFWQNSIAVWAFRGLLVLVFIALFADFIANSRPLYYQQDGVPYFPIFEEYMEWLGMDAVDTNKSGIKTDWRGEEYDYVIFPPIPFSPQPTDAYNSGYQPPNAEQIDGKYVHVHYLGTDEIGRDVASGLIHGTRKALLIGVFAMLLASFIGVFIGALGGYFGDDGLRIYRGQAIFYILTLPLVFFYSFIGLSQYIHDWNLILYLLLVGGAFILLSLALLWFSRKLAFLLAWKKQWYIPVDLIITRIIEIMSSLPVLLLILTIVGMLSEPSIWTIMFVIGLVSWTQIARYTRQELLRIRQLEYIEAAQAFGFSHLRIIFRHALPNALGPILVAIAFGIASAILFEAFLSFLGIGVVEQEVTWGKMLEEARSNFNAWWMAILPGLAIFITVTIFNLLGEGLIDALDPKLKR